MSAAATAAGYLYASGRLRGRAKDGEEPAKPETAHKRRPLRIAAIRELEPVEAPAPAAKPRPAVKIEYRTRRWRPGGE